MRAVSPAEAESSRKRMLDWAQSDRPSGGGTFGDWIFGRDATPVKDPTVQLVASKTPGAVQRNWRVPAEFPLCPETTGEMPLETYYRRLKEGSVAVVTPFDQTTVGKAATSADGSELFILGDYGESAIKPCRLRK